MKIEDLLDRKPDNDLPFDVVDDLQFHMVNDDAFYRKQYLPTIIEIEKDLESESDLVKKLMPMIERGIQHYCLKYDLPKEPNELLSIDEKNDLANNILEYEKEVRAKEKEAKGE